MKKIKKVIILAAAFAMPNIATPQSCHCYDQFNTAWQAANQMYSTCVSNYTMAPVAAWGSYASGNDIGGAISAGMALMGLTNCSNSFNTIWNQLGSTFDSCIETYCK